MSLQCNVLVKKGIHMIFDYKKAIAIPVGSGSHPSTQSHHKIKSLKGWSYLQNPQIPIQLDLKVQSIEAPVSSPRDL